MSDTKTYVMTSGKHHADGKVYVKGDRIELTQEQAKGLVNKVIDLEASYGVSVGPSNEDAQAMLDRIAQLELENEQLKEAIDEDA